MPRSDLVADDEAYMKEDIQKMLKYTDLRGRVIVLLLAAAGMRLEALATLKVGDLSQMQDSADTTRVVAAHVRVYSGTESAYNTFITPEAWECFVQYRDLRTSWGETITKDSPALISRFKQKTLKESGVKPIHLHTIQVMLTTLRKKAGVDIKSKHYRNKRYTVKTTHGYRKFFLSALKSVKTADGCSAIDHISRERLLGHRLVGQEALELNYDRSDQVKALLQDYLRAVPALTIGDQEGLKLQVEGLQADIVQYREKSELADFERAKIEKRIEEEVRRQVAEIFRSVDPSRLRPARANREIID